MKNKTIKIIVQAGVVADVKNIPDGYEVQIIDDDLEGHDVYNEEIEDVNKRSRQNYYIIIEARQNAWFCIWAASVGM